MRIRVQHRRIPGEPADLLGRLKHARTWSDSTDTASPLRESNRVRKPGSHSAGKQELGQTHWGLTLILFDWRRGQSALAVRFGSYGRRGLIFSQMSSLRFPRIGPQPHSAKNKNGPARGPFLFYGGEGGIRTHEGLLTLAGFQDQCIQPLCHLSMIVRAHFARRGPRIQPWIRRTMGARVGLS